MDDTFIRQLSEFSKLPFAELKSAHRFSRNHVPKLALRASDYTIVFHTYWAPCPHNAGKNRKMFDKGRRTERGSGLILGWTNRTPVTHGCEITGLLQILGPFHIDISCIDTLRIDTSHRYLFMKPLKNDIK